MNSEDSKANKSEKSFMSALGGMFSGWREKENPEHTAMLVDSPVIGASPDFIIDNHNDLDDSKEDVIDRLSSPTSRADRYAIYDKLKRVGVLSEGINLHISHALAPDYLTKKSVYLKATLPEHEKLVEELNGSVMALINKNAMRWAKITCEYGISYIRPKAEYGIGITGFEFNYYTLPEFIRMYERDGKLAGFTNQHMRKGNNSGVELAPPWTLIPFKIPYYTPDARIKPDDSALGLYSLLNEDHLEHLIETQDYGESFFVNAYEHYVYYMEAVESLRASRVNASKRERLILANLGKLNPLQAAQWIDELNASIKSDEDWHERRRNSNGNRSTVETKVIPMKDGTNLQTEMQQVDPNIQHIEDIMMHFKNMVGSLGLDYTMLGYSDQMSGGLGEGGFLQTSIQAKRRADYLRVALDEVIERVCTLHIFYKYKKALPYGQPLPWEVVFNSMSTSIKAAENDEREAKANRASIMTSVIDAVQQGSTSKSPTLTKRIIGDALDVSDEELKQIIKELAAKEPETENEGLMAALKDNPEATALLLGQLLNEEI